MLEHTFKTVVDSIELQLWSNMENPRPASNSGFYKRNRAYADNVATLGNAWASPYALDPNSVRLGMEVLQERC